MKKVSVIIPSYNNAKDIKECLESVLCQSLKDIEIICVNDASQDSTREIMMSSQQIDDRIRIINVVQNVGPGVTRNLALRQAVGEYIFFLDADDLLPDSEVLELLYNIASENNVLCGGNIECFQNDDVKDKFVFSGHFFNTTGMMQYAQYTRHPSWGFTRFLYSREIILENEIFFPEIRCYEDPVFFVKYMNIVREFYAINRPVYLYRQKKGIQKTFNKQKFIDLFGALKEMFPLLWNISPALYYCEYRMFLHYCNDMDDYISQNESEKDELVEAADAVFTLIDFSKIRAHLTIREYLTETLIFASFNTYIKDGRIKDGRKSRLLRVIAYAETYGMKATIKKIVSKILKHCM